MFEIVYNQIEIRNQPINQTEDEMSTKQTLREQAKTRVENSEKLSEHRDTIMYDWNEGDEHWAWVINATEDEIIDWAETTERG